MKEKDDTISQIEEALKELFPELPNLKVKETYEHRPRQRYYISVDADKIEDWREDGTYGFTKLYFKLFDFFNRTVLLTNTMSTNPNVNKLNYWIKRYSINQDGIPTVEFWFNTEYSILHSS